VIPAEINGLFGGGEDMAFHFAVSGRKIPKVGSIGFHGIDVHPAFVFGIEAEGPGRSEAKTRLSMLMPFEDKRKAWGGGSLTSTKGVRYNPTLPGAKWPKF
jgi:hypothetical protein